MSIDANVEIQRNRKGEATGLVVAVGKKKHKVDVSPSLLVEVDGKSSSVSTLDAGQAQAKVELMNKNMKRNPGLFLKSPEHVFALEADGDDYPTVATFSRDEARRLYDQKVKIDEAFRINLKKNNG